MKGVPGFGPKTACALIKEFGTIEQLLLNVNKVEPVGKRERWSSFFVCKSSMALRLAVQVKVIRSKHCY